uniref:Uncharacterized protein n=1 Tax=Pristionchus pacificus TaxID=54126 RepID=A0A2A6CVX6_PRIPA|eukprot:PDM82382.1 hypothetical protein PRIPAC_36775 [Pristionchus pacificus]
MTTDAEIAQDTEKRKQSASGLQFRPQKGKDEFMWRQICKNPKLSGEKLPNALKPDMFRTCVSSVKSIKP